MPFIIPNATDIPDSNSRFISLDQAEPDSLDFQILGNRATGVVSGCKVSVATGSYVVAIDPGWVCIDGEVYQVASTPQKALPAVPSATTSRFDLVVARLNTTTNTVSLVVLSGSESSSNPTFPKSSDRLNTPTGSYIEPTTDVVLAAVYRNGSSAISDSCIVDKRVNIPSSISIRGSANPSDSVGSDGDFYYRYTTVSGSSGTFIKKDGKWVELLLQTESGSVTPIGAIIMWPSNLTTPNPTGKTFWLECNGNYVSNSTYAALKNLLGETYGPYVGTTFKLPNLSSKFIQGSGTAGTAGGASTVTLSEGNLPTHTHSSPVHTHDVGDHTHSVTHTHAQQNTNSGGAHSHIGTKTQDGLSGDFATRLNAFIPGTVESSVFGNTGFVAPYSFNADGVADGLTPIFGVNITGMQMHWSSETNDAPSHQHAIVFPEHTGVTENSTGNTAENTAAQTGGGGGASTAISIIPPNITMRWFIRAL
jgi:microcystin-dependent protein